ncbi:MAG TPA: OmpA family protein [Nitrospirota bacterium]|nr:OmpA family protein [Nitrospirota bacterium]
MNFKSLPYLAVVLLIGIVTLWGCPKEPELTTAPEVQTQADKVTASTTGTTTVEASNEMARAGVEGLQPVYFDIGKSSIRDDAKTVMKANGDWLKANPKAKIKIEGNCDERENNRALSKRRAASAKKYLTGMGISKHRISIVNYGNTKPVCSEHDETCWQKNRRDDFVVAGE